MVVTMLSFQVPKLGQWVQIIKIFWMVVFSLKKSRQMKVMSEVITTATSEIGDDKKFLRTFHVS